MGGFSQERSALQDVTSLRRGDCQGIPHIMECRECKDTAGQGSFFILFLTLLSKHNTRDLAQCASPRELQMSQEWQEQGLGLPG